MQAPSAPSLAAVPSPHLPLPPVQGTDCSTYFVPCLRDGGAQFGFAMCDSWGPPHPRKPILRDTPTAVWDQRCDTFQSDGCGPKEYTIWAEIGRDLRPERYAMCPTYSMMQPEAFASFLRVVPSLPNAYAKSWSDRMIESVPCEPRRVSCGGMAGPAHDGRDCRRGSARVSQIRSPIKRYHQRSQG